MTTAKTTTSKRRKPRRSKGDSTSKRPAFAAAYPRDGELDKLVEAFERGNFKLVRDQADALAERTDDEAVREAVRDLRRRLEPDPIATYLLLLGVGLVVFLYAFYLLQVA